jgi:hypothetical protein
MRVVLSNQSSVCNSIAESIAELCNKHRNCIGRQPLPDAAKRKIEACVGSKSASACVKVNLYSGSSEATKCFNLSGCDGLNGARIKQSLVFDVQHYRRQVWIHSSTYFSRIKIALSRLQCAC